MSADRDRPLLPVPEPEGTGPKEVYAFFGLCAYSAQVLEQGVVNFAVGLHVRGLTTLQAEDVSAAFDRADRKTLGQLLHDLRSEINVSQETEAALTKALEDRNYLFHRFFVQHAVDFCSEPGRRDMTAELRSMTRRFQQADRLVDVIWIPLWDRLGLTKELMEDEIAQMRAEANRREGSD